MCEMKKNDNKTVMTAGRGFTLVELIVVMAILSIAAVLAVPMLSSAADQRTRAAANMLAADLEYVKNMAITHQQEYSIVFDRAGDSYQVQNTSGEVISHPLKAGAVFQVDFDGDRRISQVDITMVDSKTALFDSSDTLTFDYMGSPYSGAGTSNPLNDGEIRLMADTFSLKIRVEAITGYINIIE